jgi:hypothetical protein
MDTFNKLEGTSATLGPLATQQSGADQELLAKRRERIRDFEIESLSKTDSLEAVLGACASDLMKAMLYLRESLDRAWSPEGEPMEHLSQLLPCLDQLGKMSKQLETLVEFQLSLQDRRLLTKEFRLRLKKDIGAKKKNTPIDPGIASPADRVGPLAQKSEPKKPR